ncbi:MAG: radical SAM protein [Coriobacteriaceae bacterium]|nr:radical SAM protein [Coriobacteriaceae bacterium]
MATRIGTTRSICPECLRQLPAVDVVHDDGTVWMERTCPDHGFFEAYRWPNAEHYQAFRSLALPANPPARSFPMHAPCPFSCGICNHHARRPTQVGIEITQRCNLNCPVCFMASHEDDNELATEEFRGIFQTIRSFAGADVGVNLTGGEPTVRPDLASIVRIGREAGIRYIEISTNGLAIARNEAYLRELADAGISGVYLQFDGTTPEPYLATRGADLLQAKLSAIETCRRCGVQVVLAMTVVGGVNENQIGDVVRFALANNDIVVGVALQPAFTSGRFEVRRSVPLTMGDVIFALDAQTDGLIRVDDLVPLGCSHPLCDAGTYLARRNDEFIPVTRGLTHEEYRAWYDPNSPQGAVLWDIAAKRVPDFEGGLSLIIMDYMDRSNVDLERMEQCSMFHATADGRLIPFCSSELNDAQGNRIHPSLGRREAR